MRILHITRIIGIGGTEKVIRQICEASREQFSKIVLCAADGGGFSAFDKCVDKYYEIEDMQNKSPLVFYKIFSKLIKIIKGESIDIIHVHHRMSAVYVKILNVIMNKIIIYDAHCIHEDKRLLTRLTLRGFHIIAVGKKVQDNLVSFHKIKADNITVICNTVDGFDNKIFENSELSRLKRKGEILVGNVGRLSVQKGQKYFIEALPIVLEKYQNIKFVIVGEGGDRENLKYLAAEKGVSDHVIFLGFQKHVRSLILQFDILVLSSLWEGLPLTPIEAFSVGKAVIASNVDGTNELVKDGVNGYLYDPYKVSELAEKICKVLAEPKKWEKMSENALESYKRNYSYQVFCAKYRSYYRNICNLR